MGVGGGLVKYNVKYTKTSSQSTFMHTRMYMYTYVCTYLSVDFYVIACEANREKKKEKDPDMIITT